MRTFNMLMLFGLLLIESALAFRLVFKLAARMQTTASSTLSTASAARS